MSTFFCAASLSSLGFLLRAALASLQTKKDYSCICKTGALLPLMRTYMLFHAVLLMRQRNFCAFHGALVIKVFLFPAPGFKGIADSVYYILNGRNNPFSPQGLHMNMHVCSYEVSTCHCRHLLGHLFLCQKCFLLPLKGRSTPKSFILEGCKVQPILDILWVLICDLIELYGQVTQAVHLRHYTGAGLQLCKQGTPLDFAHPSTLSLKV